MDFKIKKITFSGIKNVKEPMTFDFIKKKRKSFTEKDFDTATIKSIYGPNGVGKTAFVEAMTLYMSFLRGLNVGQTHHNIIEGLINNECGVIDVEVTLILKEQKKEIVHSISIQKIDNVYQITNENFLVNNKVVYEVINGKINSKYLSEEIIQKSINLLTSSTFLSFYLKNFKEFPDIPKEIVYYLIMAGNISIFSESKDDHSHFFYHSELSNIEFSSIEGMSVKEIKNSLDGKQIKFSNNNIGNNYVGNNIIDIKYEDEFNKEIDKLFKFMKIFKKNIKGIKKDRKEIGDKISLRLSYEYENGNVDFEFESVGIKKLHTIFNMLERVSNGEVVIVDEFDAHIHDVVFNNILNFILFHTSGQFIFTTHNLSSMNVLKKEKNSIDIIDMEKNIITWKQSGNASPISAYKNNLLTDNDFMYDDIDLYEVFIDEN